MKNNEEIKRRSASDMLALLLHCVTGIVVALLLSLIAVFFVNAEKLSPDMIPALSSVFVFVGSVLTGFISAKKFGKPILIALLQSLIFLFLLYLTGVLLYVRIVPEGVPSGTISACIVGMIVGAISSAIKVQKKTKIIKNKK